MWYGFAKKNFLGGLRIFCTIAIAVSVLSVVDSFVNGSGVRNWTALIVLLAIMPGIWLALSAIWSTTWLKLEGNELAWYLWKRFLLLRCPTDAVVSIGSGSFSAVLIRTRMGTIRLIGLHASDRADLKRRLTEANPDIRLV